MDKTTIWKNILEELKLTVSTAVFQTLFSQTQLISLEKNIATISCPNPYVVDLIEKRYYQLLKSILDRQLKENINLIISIQPSPPKIYSSRPGPLFDKPTTNHPASPVGGQSPTTNLNPKTGLHPRYTFETFIVGNANNFAYAASQGIIQNPGKTYDPFFVWGGVGVGKTHLIQAVGNEILKKYPDFKVLYVNAETFGNEVVSALRSQTMPRFKEKYRHVDVLLVDDIQFIAGKEYIQEEFFHTFNSLYLAGKQICLTSDRKPEEIGKIEDRLISRFMGGLTVDIQKPDYEMRVAILKQKVEEKEFYLPENSLNFIAETIQTNIRELEGNLLQIVSQAQALGQTPDLEFVKNFFGFKKSVTTRKTNYRRILSVVSKHFHIKTSDICGKVRRKEIALARHIAAYLLRKELELPLQQIGRLLGNRDHTSIIHAEKKIDRLFATNQDLRHKIISIRKDIYA